MQLPVKCPVSSIVKQRKVLGRDYFEVSWEGMDGLETSAVPADLVERYGVHNLNTSSFQQSVTVEHYFGFPHFFAFLIEFQLLLMLSAVGRFRRRFSYSLTDH